MAAQQVHIRHRIWSPKSICTTKFTGRAHVVINRNRGNFIFNSQQASDSKCDSLYTGKPLNDVYGIFWHIVEYLGRKSLLEICRSILACSCVSSFLFLSFSVPHHLERWRDPNLQRWGCFHRAAVASRGWKVLFHRIFSREAPTPTKHSIIVKIFLDSWAPMHGFLFWHSVMLLRVKETPSESEHAGLSHVSW